MLRTDLNQIKEIALQDKISNSFFINRLQELETLPWSLQNEITVFESKNEIKSAIYNGANLVPLATNDESRVAFAQYLLETPRRASSIVGIKYEVLGIWDLLKPFWPKPREIRETQPLLFADDEPILAPDPLVRPALIRELDILLPACVSMFTEEVGVSPVVGSSEQSYRNRIADLINHRRIFTRIDNGQVTFKAEIGVQTQWVSQIQGVWVPPQLRGRNFGKAGMAATLSLTRKYFSPIASLYVNDYNHRAQAVYKSVGFQEHSTFATVLF